MALMGRKPKPTVVKMVAKTQKPSRVKSEPRAVRRGLPKPPKYLDEEAKEEWDLVVQDLYDCGILSTTDRTILGAYCMAVSRLIDAQTSVQAAKKADKTGFNGMLSSSAQGHAVQNPLVGQFNRALLSVARLCEQMGMTPSARSRVTPLGSEDESKDPASKYLDDEAA